YPVHFLMTSGGSGLFIVSNESRQLAAKTVPTRHCLLPFTYRDTKRETLFQLIEEIKAGVDCGVTSFDAANCCHRLLSMIDHDARRKMSAFKQDGQAITDPQMFSRHGLDLRSTGVERANPAAAVECLRAEMILQRFDRNRARHPLAVHQRGEDDREVGITISRRVGREIDLHGRLM